MIRFLKFILKNLLFFAVSKRPNGNPGKILRKGERVEWIWRRSQLETIERNNGWLCNRKNDASDNLLGVRDWIETNEANKGCVRIGMKGGNKVKMRH